MTRTSIWREEFDSSREFVAARTFTFNGKRYLAGAPIDKGSCTQRRLQILYDVRRISMLPPPEPPPPKDITVKDLGKGKFAVVVDGRDAVAVFKTEEEAEEERDRLMRLPEEIE